MRTVVVGAGVGGLACAVHLASAGHAVTVFERADRVGGKVGVLERDGFRFDTGPTLLTVPQAFDDVLPGLRERLVRLDPVVRHVFADGTVLDSTSDAEEMARRVSAALGEDAGQDWRRLWRRAGRVWDASWRHVLRSTLDSPLDLLRLAWRLPDLAAIAPLTTLRSVSRGMDPRLRMLVDRYATYTGSDPRQAPAALAAIPYAELAFGGWYLPGGLSTVVDLLLARCVELGVAVRTGTPVSTVTAAAGRVDGVRLADGTWVAADTVVANADAAAVYRDLWPDRRRARRLTSRSLGGFVLLLALDGDAGPRPRHTVYFPADYDAEFDAIFGRSPRPVSEPAVYISVGAAPPGCEAWFVLVNAPPQGPVDWRPPGLADAYADRILDVLAARGVEVRDRLRFRVVRTPADLEADTATPGGAIYGTPSHGLRRPTNRGPVAGLYLVGGSTHPGGGLPMVALGAATVARLVTSDLATGC